MQQNRPQDALEQFRQCESMKYNAAPRIGEARALRSLGEVDEARRILEAVVTLSREDVRRSFQRVGDRFEGAPAKLELGTLESASGRYKQALPWLDAAVRANPRDLSARHAWGIALRGVGRNDEAARELAAVREARIALREVDRLADLIHKNPDLVDERVRIGELYLKYESQLTGEFWLNTALARDPRNKRARELLAELYESRAADDPAYRPLAEHHRQLADESPERSETDENGPATKTNQATAGVKE
jgi:tetratricopeptide (TPR) repeat protein